MALEDLIPSGDGANSEFTPTGAFATNWESAETSDGDTSYNFSTTSSERDDFTYAAFSPSTSAIAGMDMVIEYRKPGAGNPRMQSKLTLASGVHTGSNTVLTSAVYVERILTTYLTNPATSSDWTEDELDAASADANRMTEFGYNHTDGDDIRITYTTSRIDYTPTAGGGRIMSSLVRAGGLVGAGGIAGAGGGLAG